MSKILGGAIAVVVALSVSGCSTNPGATKQNTKDTANTLHSIEKLLIEQNKILRSK